MIGSPPQFVIYDLATFSDAALYLNIRNSNRTIFIKHYIWMTCGLHWMLKTTWSVLGSLCTLLAVALFYAVEFIALGWLEQTFLYSDNVV